MVTGKIMSFEISLTWYGPVYDKALFELFAPWALLSSADFFQNQLFRKILSGIPSECQTDWIQISPTFCRF